MRKSLLSLLILLLLSGCGARANILYRMYNSDPMPLDNVARVLAYSPEIKAVINKEKVGNPLLNNGEYWVFAPGSEDTKAGHKVNTDYKNKSINYIIELLPNKEYKFWMSKDKYRTIKPKGGEVYVYQATKWKDYYDYTKYANGYSYEFSCKNCTPYAYELKQAKSYTELPKNFTTRHNDVFYFDANKWIKDDRSLEVVRNFSSGNIDFRYTVKNGKATKFENWYQSGQKKTEYAIKDGLLSGELYRWQEDGTRQ